MRRCQKCKDLKLLNDFFFRNKKRNLRSSYCKICFQKINRKLVSLDPEKLKARKKREYKKNIRRYLDVDLKRKYGISLEEFEKKEKNQSFLCEICAKPNSGKRRFHVDHCHKTGKVRDLLCNHCNRLIAAADEDMNVLLNAIKYLEKHKSNKN
jgi:hypothetical protein